MSRGKGAEKKRATRVAAGPHAPGFARSLGETAGRLAQPLLPLVLLAVAYVGLSFLFWRPVNSAPTARLTAAGIRAAILKKPCKPWISKQDFEQVADLGISGAGHSVFEPELSHALAHAYENSPWVERVAELRLRYPADLDVDIDWRQPTARVERSNLVLDRHGYVLNLLPDGAIARELPVIAGVQCMRTEAGKQVPERDLLDALELRETAAEALRLSPGNLKITALLREPGGTWRVLTDRGPAIYWGVYSDEPPVDEPRNAEKADLLRRRLCEIKDPGLLEYVKVCFAQAPVKPRVAAPAIIGQPTPVTKPKK